jgi:glycosyltransferase involved in cell wall biosynthesis
MTVYVDHTHLGRHVTGIERITMELFSPTALAPLELTPVIANGVGNMVLTQTLGLPLRMSNPAAVLLCPGFPPSPLLLPFAERIIPYIHDLFLITRPSDINARAKLYMAKPFRLAVQRYPRFLVNSLDTAQKLSQFCRSDAEIIVYRPKVRNVFGIDSALRNQPRDASKPIRLISIGTIEPRKNYRHAAHILHELRRIGFPDATLDIVGREGWGNDWQALQGISGITLSGYCSSEDVRNRLQQADALLCTSHEEGLGLPLLEAQYAGLPIIAPDDAVFREVLGESGIFIDRTDPAAAAQTIRMAIAEDDWRARYRDRDARNLARWNALADDDRAHVSQMIASLLAQRDSPTPRSRGRLPVSDNNTH